MAAADPDGMVQLGRYDVPAALLRAADSSLVELIGAESARLADDIHTPPTSGWRVIVGDLAFPDNPPIVLAAPWSKRTPRGWMLIQVHWRNGQWRPGVDVSMNEIRPSRAARRADLTLEWVAAAMSASVGSRPTLLVRLRNTATRPWIADPHDSGPPVGSMYDSYGQPIPQATWTMEALHVQPLPPLGPGESTELQVDWVWSGIEDVPAGEYQVDAEVLDLQLRTVLATMRLL